MKLTNKHNLSLSLAILFSHSDYDGPSKDDDPKTISATSILKPLRAIVIGLQNPNLYSEADLVDFIPSVFGSAVHAFAEQAWSKPETISAALDALSIGPETAKVIRINPTNQDKNTIPIYVEKRTKKELTGWTISGKFDVCINGKLSDYKTCSVWSAIFGSNDIDYRMQGSIYRWLNQDIVTEDEISIEKIFTDWSSSKARSDKQYPQLRAESKNYPLMSIQATEEWLTTKLQMIDRYLPLPQEEIPLCTEEDLWSSDPKWKYYKTEVAKRATKVYTSSSEAQARLSSEGTGEVIHFPGEVRRCTYCNVSDICTQAADLRSTGRLK